MLIQDVTLFCGTTDMKQLALSIFAALVTVHDSEFSEELRQECRVQKLNTQNPFICSQDINDARRVLFEKYGTDSGYDYAMSDLDLAVFVFMVVNFLPHDCLVIMANDARDVLEPLAKEAFDEARKRSMG